MIEFTKTITLGAAAGTYSVEGTLAGDAVQITLTDVAGKIFALNGGSAEAVARTVLAMLDSFKEQGWSLPGTPVNGQAAPALPVEWTQAKASRKGRPPADVPGVDSDRLKAYLEAVEAWGGEGISVNELADLLNVDRSVAQRTLLALTTAGLLVRRADTKAGSSPYRPPCLYSLPNGHKTATPEA